MGGYGAGLGVQPFEQRGGWCQHTVANSKGVVLWCGFRHHLDVQRECCQLIQQSISVMPASGHSHGRGHVIRSAVVLMLG